MNLIEASVKKKVMTNFLYQKFDKDYSVYEFNNQGFYKGTNFITCSGTKGIGTFFETRISSFLDRVIFEIPIQFIENSIIGLYRRGGIVSTYTKIDTVNKKLQLFKSWDGVSTSLTLQTESTITQNINSIDHYLVRLKKQGGVLLLQLKNKRTGYLDEIVYDNGLHATIDMWCGNQWGVYGISHWQGYIKAYSFKVSYDAIIPPIYGIYGHSYIEGNSLTGIGINYKARWSYKLYEHFNKQVIISGQGGATSSDLLTRLDFDFRVVPKYAILNIAENDLVFATWRDNLLAIIKKIEAKGCIPIIVTTNPRDDRLTFCAQTNDYILNTLALKYQILDHSAQLTVGGNRTQRINSLFLPDAIHPNIEGHELLYQYDLTQLI